MDNDKAGLLFRHCADFVWIGLFVISNILGIILIGVLILWSLISDLLFGDT